jgi:hypothetical protein
MIGRFVERDVCVGCSLGRRRGGGLFIYANFKMQSHSSGTQNSKTTRKS